MSCPLQYPVLFQICLQSVQQLLVPLAFRKEADLAAVFINIGKIDAQTLCGQLILRPLGPLDDRHAVGINVFLEPDVLQLPGIIQAVKVDMIERTRP